MKTRLVIYLIILGFCLISFQSKNDAKTKELHAFINQRIKEAGSDNYKLLEKTLQEVAPQFNIETDTLATLYHRLGTAYFNNDLEMKALPYYQKALEIRRKILKPNNYDLTKTLQGYGRTLVRVRRIEEALPLLEENLKIRIETLPSESDSLAEAYMMLGGTNVEGGNYSKAIEFNHKAVSIFAKNERDSTRWSYALQYLGNSFYRAIHYDSAIIAYNKSIKLMEKINDTKGISECSHNIGCALSDQKRFAEALPYFEKAQKFYPHSEYLNTIANTYLELKQYPKAYQYINQSLDFAAKNQSLCYYYIPRIYVTLGDIYAGDGKPNEAISAYNQSIQLFLNDSVSIKKGPLSPEGNRDVAARHIFDNLLIKSIAKLEKGTSITVNTEGGKKFKIQKSAFIDRGFQRIFVMIEELTIEIFEAEKQAYAKVIRMMAHEVNNSIGAVNSILDTVGHYIPPLGGTRGADADVANALKIAIERNDHLNHFMRNFADVIRLPEPRKETFDLTILLKNVATLMEYKAKEKNISFDFQIEHPLSPRGIRDVAALHIVADLGQIEQVLINIIKNAIEAQDKTKGFILFKLDNTKRELSIIDNGKGISKAVEPLLFSPFFTNKNGGQGIGLTLIREVLTNHGFTFSLKTEKNTENTEGVFQTIFKIRF